MKALQKNQGRTDQMLGAMADVLTSVAIPNQQWVSCNSGLESVCIFTVCLCVFMWKHIAKGKKRKEKRNTYGGILEGL